MIDVEHTHIQAAIERYLYRHSEDNALTIANLSNRMQHLSGHYKIRLKHLPVTPYLRAPKYDGHECDERLLEFILKY